MIKKDVSSYISENFADNSESVSMLSKSEKGNSLVSDETKLYDFDRITKKIYGSEKCPTSADALLVTDKILLLTEFKSGFKRKISQETLNYEWLTCPDDGTKVCKDYAKLLIDKGKLEINELLDSIKFKAVESYMTLEKKIMPSCKEFFDGRRLRAIFCVVIDDYVDSMEDTLAELAEKQPSNNMFDRVKSALVRFVNLKSSDGTDYYYDEVKILSPYEYKSYINSMMVFR